MSARGSGVVSLPAAQLRRHLQVLSMEHAAALNSDLAGNSAYMDDLRDEIDETLVDYVVASVGELARLRGRLAGPLHD